MMTVTFRGRTRIEINDEGVEKHIFFNRSFMIITLNTYILSHYRDKNNLKIRKEMPGDFFFRRFGVQKSISTEQQSEMLVLSQLYKKTDKFWALSRHSYRRRRLHTILKITHESSYIAAWLTFLQLQRFVIQEILSGARTFSAENGEHHRVLFTCVVIKKLQEKQKIII